MSVLNCSKLNCENIMCDIYVPGAGYVCYECAENFKKYLAIRDYSSEDLSKEENITELLVEFLNTDEDLTHRQHPAQVISDYFSKFTN